MKLEFHGHDERYVVEQSLMNLFPGELPVYEPIGPGDDSWAIISLREEGDRCHVTVELSYRGKAAPYSCGCPLSGTDFDREGQRRHAIARCFFLAARAVTGTTPPWGMLTGVRPDKPVTWALEAGRTPQQARAMMEQTYFVTPSRAALALETGAAGCLTEEVPQVLLPGKFYIQVEDTMLAIGQVARAYREKFPIPVIGITGSVGKTTTKDMVAAVLGEKYKVLKTEGNLNNEIGAVSYTHLTLPTILRV